MKKNIHPSYKTAKVICTCGNAFEVKSSLSTIKIEACSKCHPAYTGQKKFIDTAGQLERFKKRLEKIKEIKNTNKK